jgi:4'-phosphopantetheinyl transferase
LTPADPGAPPGSPAPALDGTRVHVWLTDPGLVTDRATLDLYDALMAPEERTKQRRFRFARDRHDCLVARALVRATLSRYADPGPASWRFEQNRYGRPRLVPGQCGADLRFNLSHTRGLIALAVTVGHEIGVDVESLSRPGETVAVADRYFSAVEIHALRALPENRQRERFFEYWTLKESYIKARGMGLALPLDQFSFLLDDQEGIGIEFDPRLDEDPEHWQFDLRRPTADHMLAIGVRKGPGPDLDIRVMRTVPLRDGCPGPVR